MTSGSCFTAWEAMLAEADKEAKTHVELSQKLSQSVANQLSEITARKRLLKKKVRTNYTSMGFYLEGVEHRGFPPLKLISPP
jgi:hypothetical protein